MTMTALGCWVGLSKCGCSVAVVIDDAAHASDVHRTKVEFVEAGLQLVYATQDEWTEKYLPTFLAYCPHREPKP